MMHTWMRNAKSLAKVAMALADSDSCDSTRSIVVSLTTYPPRVLASQMAIRSILKQSVKPGRIVLTLSEQDFPARRIPRGLDGLRERGLEVLWTKTNTRSYKKLLPLWETELDEPVVTIDDDVMYPRRWLKCLLEGHARHPDNVLGFRATRMLMSQDGRELQPYATWPLVVGEVSGPDVFLTGVGGILYPPRALGPETSKWETFMQLAPYSDDLWFKVMALLKGTNTTSIGGFSPVFPHVPGTQRTALWRDNVNGGQNDEALSRLSSEFPICDMLLMQRGERW